MRWSSFLMVLALFASIFSLVGLSASDAQTIGWVKYLDGIQQKDDGYGVAVYSNYVIVVGSYTNGTNAKAFVANFSKTDGSIKWVKGLKIHDNDYAYDVAVDTVGNIYVVGQAQDVGVGYYDFVAKFKPDGTLQWSKIWSSGIQSQMKFGGVAVDSSGYVYVAGEIPEGAYTDCLIMKLKPDGSIEWSKKIGASDNDEYALDVAVDGGNIYVVGHNKTAGVFLLKLRSSDGGMIWGRTWQITSVTTNGRALAVDPSGSAYVAGDFLASPPARDVFIVKFDQNGAPQWSKGWDFSSDFAYSVAADSQQVYVAGYVSSPNPAGPGGTDRAASIIAFDQAGDLKWDVLFNGTSWDEARGVASGSLYITGSTDSPSLTLEDVSGTFGNVMIFPFRDIFGEPTDVTFTLTNLGVEYTTYLPSETTRGWWDIFVLSLEIPAPPPPPPAVGGEVMSPQSLEVWASSAPLIAAALAILIIAAGIIVGSSARSSRRG